MSTPDRTKPDESGSQSGQPDRVWLPLGAAAHRLGITHDTARKRLERGQLVGEKRGGRWFVAVAESDEPGPVARTYQDEPRREMRQPDTRSADQGALIGHLSAENVWLRGQIETYVRDAADARQVAAAERERADVLMRESFRRIEVLTAGAPVQDQNVEAGPESPQTRQDGLSGAIAKSPDNESLSPPAEPSKRGFIAWWSRLFGS